MTKEEVILKLKDDNSVSYSGYLQMVLQHIEKYGEEPKMSFVGKTYENSNMYRSVAMKRLYGRNTLISDATGIVISNNKAFEIRNDELFVADCTVEQYVSYQKPMSWIVYFTG